MVGAVPARDFQRTVRQRLRAQRRPGRRRDLRLPDMRVPPRFVRFHKFSRRLVKEQDAGNDLQPIVDQMNQLARQYHERSRPEYCARRGFVDEMVRFEELRRYQPPRRSRYLRHTGIAGPRLPCLRRIILFASTTCRRSSSSFCCR